MSDQQPALAALDLAPIKQRAEAATAGPWRWYDPETDEEVTPGDEHYTVSLRTTWERPTASVGPLPEFILSHVEYERESSDDAVFIAHAREDVAALIAEVERLRDARNV